MMKKFLFAVLAFVCASDALAQTDTIQFGATQYLVLDAGGTSCAAVNGFQINRTTNVITPVMPGGASVGTATLVTCPGSSGGGSTTTATVTLSLPTSSYQIGSGSSAPILYWSSTISGVTCSLPSLPTGITATSTTTNSTSGYWTLNISSSLASGNYTLTPSCSGSGISVSYYPGTSVTLSVTGASTTPPSAACASTQTAVLPSTTKQLTRQCTTSVYYGAVSGRTVNNSSNLLSDVASTALGGSSAWGSYVSTPIAMTIASGSYVAFAFTPVQTTHMLTLVANGTYGDPGMMSISTVPGAFFSSSAGYVCSPPKPGGAASLALPSSQCNLNMSGNTTYYVNFADSNASGQVGCSSLGGVVGNCSSSVVAYSTSQQ